MLRLLLLACLAQAPTAPSKVPYVLGLNPTGPKYYQTDRLFVDQMLVAPSPTWQALPATKDASGNFASASADPAGNPTQDARVELFLASCGDGAYTLLWNGSGTVSVQGRNARLGPVTTDAAGRHTLPMALSGTGPIYLSFRQVDPASPPSSVRFIPPGYSTAAPPLVRTEWSRRYGAFGCLRMLDVTQVNGSTESNWADRVLPGASQVNGVCWEYVADMARAARTKILWINMPVGVTDDYVNQCAELILTRMLPGTRVFVQYSNELWNAGFSQSRSIQAMAATDPVVGALPVGKQAPSWEAWRVVQIGRIWRARAQAHGLDPRQAVTPVFGGQNNNPWWISTGLAFLKAQGMTPSAEVGRIAIAPYWGLVPDADGLTVDQLFAGMRTYYGTKTLPGMQAHALVSQSYGIPLAFYESGQSILPGGKKLSSDAKQAAQDDPRMTAMYATFFADAAAVGVSEANLYGGVAGLWSQFGFWSHMQDAGASGSRRWDTVLAALLAPGDVTLDGVCDYEDYLLIRSNLGQQGAWREDGDLDGDGSVAAPDISAWAASGPALTDAQRAAVAAAIGVTPSTTAGAR